MEVLQRWIFWTGNLTSSAIICCLDLLVLVLGQDREILPPADHGLLLFIGEVQSVLGSLSLVWRRH